MSQNTFINEFLLESNESISFVSNSLTNLEKNPNDYELINSIYRAFHTLKGASRFLKFSKLEEITHHLENLLDMLREKKISVSSNIIDVLLLGVDVIQDHLKKIESTGLQSDIDSEPLKNKIAAVMGGTTLNSESAHRSTQNMTNLQELGAKETNSKDVATNAADDKLASSAIASTPAMSPSGQIPTLTEEAAAAVKSVTDTVVRVNVNLLDKIMNVVGELVLTRNQILQFANSMEGSELHKLAAQLNVITTELQSDIMTTRMQPIGNILSRFERIVRDMARDLGKNITLKIEGKDTELDRTLLEAIKDPLTHLVRNAVDHGMETLEERKKSGKKIEGTITIKSYHEAGQVTIEISDDGKGINRERIKAKAIEKGILTQDRVKGMSDRDILGIIFLPGFSTAAQVTNISGRGVGMDVVKTNIEKIGGQVDIVSIEGQGTTFKMKIPLTLAIIPALLVYEKSESFAIPQINLVELVRLEGEKLSTIEKINDAEFFRLRGKLIPLLRLSNIINNRSDTHAKNEEAVNIIVLNAEGRIYGLIVDAIHDTQEIVVKPLSKHLKAIGIYSGATILGDGHVALILDVNGLAGQFQIDSHDKESIDNNKKVGNDVDSQDVLIFKTNSKGIYAVPSSVVNRLEKFPKDQIEYTGEQAVIKYREKPMPLVHVDRVFDSSLTKNLDFEDVVNVFVCSLGGQYIGFVVKDIIDITNAILEINPTSTEQKGVLGSIFVNGKTVTMIDVYSFIELSPRKKLKDKIASAFKSKEKPVVLIAEDTAIFRKMVRSIFEELGFEILMALDGAEAVKILAEKYKEIDLIVSDIEMPNMTGYEFAKAVRENTNWKHLPMIALTTRYSPDDIQKGKVAGFTEYLEKFKKDEIITTVKSVLGEKVAV